MVVLTGIIFGIIGALFEVFLSHAITIKNIYPFIAISFVIFSGLYGGTRSGLWTGFAVGIILDFYSTHLIGIGVIFFSLLGFLSGYLIKNLYIEKIYSRFIILIFSNFLYSIVVWISVRSTESGLLRPIFINLIPQVIYSSIIGSIIIMILYFLVKKFPILTSFLYRINKKK